MGRCAELWQVRQDAAEMTELLAHRPNANALRDAVIDQEAADMLRLVNALHHQIDAVPESLPLHGDVVHNLRLVRLTIDAIVKADDRAAERVA